MESAARGFSARISVHSAPSRAARGPGLRGQCSGYYIGPVRRKIQTRNGLDRALALALSRVVHGAFFSISAQTTAGEGGGESPGVPCSVAPPSGQPFGRRLRLASGQSRILPLPGKRPAPDFAGVTGTSNELKRERIEFRNPFGFRCSIRRCPVSCLRCPARFVLRETQGEVGVGCEPECAV